MAQLGQRTLADTAQQHVDDHNQLHDKANYVFDVTDFGAVGDGVTNDGPNINTALVAASTAAEAAGVRWADVLLPPGVYSVEENVEVTNSVRLVGYGATILRNFNSDFIPTIQGSGVDNWGLFGLSVDGNKDNLTPTEFKAGVNMVDCKNVTLRDLLLFDNAGDGLTLGASGATVNENVTAYNVQCETNYRNGLSVGAGRNISFEACSFNNAAGALPEAGIDVEPNDGNGLIENVEFIDCDMIGNAGHGLQVLLAASPAVVQQSVSVIGGISQGNGSYGVNMQHGTDINLSGFTVADNASFGVQIAGNTLGVSFTDCTIRGNGNRGISCIPISGVSILDVDVLGCTITDNTGHGVQFDSTAATAINGVRFIGNRVGNVVGNTQTRGYTSYDAKTTNETIVGNDLRGNDSAAYLSSSDAATKIIHSNQGIAPATVSGSRGDSEQALADLLAELDTAGIITDTTTA